MRFLPISLKEICVPSPGTPQSPRPVSSFPFAISSLAFSALHRCIPAGCVSIFLFLHAECFAFPSLALSPVTHPGPGPRSEGSQASVSARSVSFAMLTPIPFLYEDPPLTQTPEGALQQEQSSALFCFHSPPLLTAKSIPPTSPPRPQLFSHLGPPRAPHRLNKMRGRGHNKGRDKPRMPKPLSPKHPP